MATSFASAAYHEECLSGLIDNIHRHTSCERGLEFGLESINVAGADRLSER